jgi:hypothetical protein
MSVPTVAARFPVAGAEPDELGVDLEAESYS